MTTACIRPLPFLAVLSCLTAVSCGSPSEPNRLPPPIEFDEGDVIQGNVTAGDTVVYALSSTSAMHQVRFRGLSGSAVDTVVLRVLLAVDGSPVLTLRAAGNDTSIMHHVSPWTFYVGDGWLLKVHLAKGTVGSFALQGVANGIGPELAAATPPFNQEVFESIDIADDIDDFRIPGNTGDEWVIHVRTSGTIRLRLYSPTDSLMAEGELADPMTVVEEYALWGGRITLPAAGQYRLRVTGFGPAAPYSLKFTKVNTAPEQGAGSATVGDVIVGAIEAAGDVDELSFSGTAGQQMNLLVQIESGLSAGLTVTARDGAATLRSVTATQVAAMDATSSGRFTLPVTGTYSLRISARAFGVPAQTTGAYRVELYPVNPAAENGATLAVDGPPITSAIDRPGDIDEFTVQGSAGAMAVLRFEATPVPNSGSLVAQLIAVDGAVLSSAAIATWGVTGGTTLSKYSLRETLPATGSYRVRVRSSTDDEAVTAPYLLELYTVSAAPEQAPAIIQFGDTITERIDRPGDLDVFTFAGVAGRDANIFLGWLPAVGEVLGVLVLYPIPPNPLAVPLTPSLDSRDVGRFPMTDAQYTWIVDPKLGADANSSGEYRFRLVLIDSTPETQPPSYVVGDTLAAEALSPAGDIDVFTFELNAETTMKGFFEGDPFLASATVIDAAGTMVWSSQDIRGDLPFTMPAGQYRVRVLGHNDVIFRDPFFVHPASTPYRFALTPQ